MHSNWNLKGHLEVGKLLRDARDQINVIHLEGEEIKTAFGVNSIFERNCAIADKLFNRRGEEILNKRKYG
jgi:hypothetical protein